MQLIRWSRVVSPLSSDSFDSVPRFDLATVCMSFLRLSAIHIYRFENRENVIRILRTGVYVCGEKEE